MVLNSKLILKSSNFFRKQDISNDWPVVWGVVFWFVGQLVGVLSCLFFATLCKYIPLYLESIEAWHARAK